jgi:hypothetical protein
VTGKLQQDGLTRLFVWCDYPVRGWVVEGPSLAAMAQVGCGTACGVRMLQPHALVTVYCTVSPSGARLCRYRCAMMVAWLLSVAYVVLLSASVWKCCLAWAYHEM